MDFIGQLWLPIVLSAVAVFLVSALVWTAMPHHKKEFAGLPAGDEVRAAIGRAGFTPGQYVFPWVSDDEKARRTPEAMAIWAEGPSGWVTLMPTGPMNMGAMMTKSFLSNIVIGVLVAYIAHHALQPGAEYLKVFQIVGATGFVAYSTGSMYECIWFGRPWKSWLLQAFDALLYSLVMAGVFGWLWPR